MRRAALRSLRFPRGRTAQALRPALVTALAGIALGGIAWGGTLHAEEATRRTPIVIAVEKVRDAVVNLQGPKFVPPEGDEVRGSGLRQVNGMGTGVIIDERGYILTNHHVVDGVREIEVKLSDKTSYRGRLIAHDQPTDLAILKIDAERKLPVIPLGISSDLMEGEPVIAVGNAMGYTHSVTRGIISALHRTIPLTETQSYRDLIQTDTSINPGNSGGPLLNIEGDMIGVNVAVRVGAQGIAFAIPTDQALEVAAHLISRERTHGLTHGIVARTDSRQKPPRTIVDRILPGSPAASVGLQAGDQIVSVGEVSVHRLFDLERAFLEQPSGSPLTIAFQRNGQSSSVAVGLTPVGGTKDSIESIVWNQLGLKLAAESATAGDASLAGRFRGGMRITAVRPMSPAAAQPVQPGDILVGMHIWETTSFDNLAYILNRTEIREASSPIRFLVLRGDQTFYGYMNVANIARTASHTTTR